MIIIWNGLGLIVPVVIVLAIGIVELAVNEFFGVRFFSEHSWPKVTAAFLAGITLRVLGIWMNNPANKRMNWNESKRGQPGDYLEFESSHTFFFLPVQNWYYVMMAASLCIIMIDVCRVITADW